MKDVEPEIKELSEFLSEFNRESDRGAALTAAAMLDQRLEEILSGYLADVPATQDLLSGYSAPLGTFSSRNSIAFALGLIQENEYNEINVVRKIRNEFGHSWKGTDFKSGKGASLCNQLPWLGPKELEAKSTARERFNFAIAILLTDFLWRVRLVKKEKRVNRVWPNKSR
jgi:mannitol operon repressor